MDEQNKSVMNDGNNTDNQIDFENSTIFTTNSSLSNNKNAKSDKTEGGIAVKSHMFIKYIAILVAVAIVLSGSMVAMKFLWPVESNSNIEQTEANGTINLTESANVPLDKMKNVDKNSISNVKSVVITNSSGSLTVVPDKLVESTSEDGEKTVRYKLVGYDDIPLNYANVNDVVSSILSVVATSKLNGDWSLAQCGLDKPQAKVDVTMADNSKFDLLIGKEVPNGNNDYYAKTSLKDGIYIVSSDLLDTFNTTILDYTSIALTNALSSDGDDDDYYTNTNLSKFDSMKIGGSNVGNEIVFDYKTGGNDALIYRINTPVKTYADDEQMSTILSSINSGISATYTVAVRPTKADLAKYGLDKPYFTIDYKIKDEKHKISLSKPDYSVEGYYNCMIDDVPVIYGMMKDIYEFFEWKLSDIRSNILYARKIETIDTMTIEFDGKSTLYDINYEAEKKESTTDTTSTTDSDDDNYEIKILCNSEQVDAPSFQTIYSHLILARPTQFLKAGESAPSGTPKLTIICKGTNNSVDVLKFVKYDERFYSYTINEIGDGLVKYSDLDKLISEYRAFQKGEKIED